MAWLQRALMGAAISAGQWLLLAGGGTPAARMRACADAARAARQGLTRQPARR